jgi:hypothetical protein
MNVGKSASLHKYTLFKLPASLFSELVCCEQRLTRSQISEKAVTKSSKGAGLVRDSKDWYSFMRERMWLFIA